VSWVKNYPKDAGQWELVATYARQRYILTERLVAHLKKLGARPEKIAGIWMVKAEEWAAVESLLDEPKVPEPNSLPPAEPQQLSLAPGARAELYKPVEEKLKDQAQLIELLKRQVAELAAKGAA